jgi:single-strand DNA-binding protein
MNLNKVMLIGRIGKDPEVNYIKEDVPVARFSLATNESYKKDGEWRDITEWHNVVAWRFTAKYCENNLKKGMLVYVEGKLQTRQWEGQDGNTRYTTEIVADQIRMLEKRGDNNFVPLPKEEFPGSSSSSSATSQSNNNQAPVSDNFLPNDSAEDSADDLPF